MDMFDSRGGAIVASLIGTALFAAGAEYAHRAGYKTLAWVIALLPFILAIIVLLMFGTVAVTMPASAKRLAAGCCK